MKQNTITISRVELLDLLEGYLLLEFDAGATITEARIVAEADTVIFTVGKEVEDVQTQTRQDSHSVREG